MDTRVYMAEGASAKEVLQGITEPYTSANVKRVKVGEYEVTLEGFGLTVPKDYMPRGWHAKKGAPQW